MYPMSCAHVSTDGRDIRCKIGRHAPRDCAACPAYRLDSTEPEHHEPPPLHERPEIGFSEGAGHD